MTGFDQTVGSLDEGSAATLGAGTLSAGGNNATTPFSGVISGAARGIFRPRW